MKKHSITIKGHRTSYSLEAEFQTELAAIAEREGKSIAQLITIIDTRRKDAVNLSSKLRLYILQDLKRRLNGA